MRAQLEQQLVSIALIDRDFAANLPDGFNEGSLHSELARSIVETCRVASKYGLRGKLDDDTFGVVVVESLVLEGYSRRAVWAYITASHRSPAPEIALTTADAARLTTQEGTA